MKKLNLVAHRGLAATSPENTLTAMKLALEAGVRFLELDVQLTKDLVPVLFHDVDLARMTGKSGRIFDYTVEELKTVSASDRDRFGDSYVNERIPTLGEFVDLLRKRKDIKAFVEIKTESVDEFGKQLVTQKIISELESVKQQCYLISFGYELVTFLKATTDYPVGWVLYKFNNEYRQKAELLQPEFLICNYTKVNEALWDGRWQWFLYEITDAKNALHWLEKGVCFQESMNVKKLTDELRQSGVLTHV